MTTTWVIAVVMKGMLFISMNGYPTEEACEEVINTGFGMAWTHSVSPACMKITEPSQ